MEAGVTQTPWAVGSTTLTPGDLIPAGTVFTFDLDLSNPDIVRYVQESLDLGLLPLMVTSHTLVKPMGGSFPAFLTRENPLVDFGIENAAQVEITWQPADTTPCPADFNDNGSVDFEDLLSILSAYGPCADCPQDLDGNGEVDFNDLVTVLAAFGPCP